MKKNQNKRVTTLDIAEKAGVTKATVSYALNGTGSVSSELTKKIRRIADELGYRTNRLAVATRTGQTKTIGLVLPDLTNPFFPALAQAVQSAARQKGYSVFLVDCQNRIDEEDKGLDLLVEHSIDGLIWCPTEDHSVAKFKPPFPTVIIDRPIDGFDSVYADSYRGGQLQGEYLLKNGHKNIGVLSGPERSPSAISRREGLYSTVASKCNILWDFELEYNLNIPQDIQSKILKNQPTCVVAANDTLAISLIRLYHNSGVNVPDDVSIIGFDDIDWADLTVPPLTTIKLHVEHIGEDAFKLLLRRLNDPSAELSKSIIDVHVIERDSFKQLSH